MVRTVVRFETDFDPGHLFHTPEDAFRQEETTKLATLIAEWESDMVALNKERSRDAIKSISALMVKITKDALVISSECSDFLEETENLKGEML